MKKPQLASIPIGLLMVTVGLAACGKNDQDKSDGIGFFGWIGICILVGVLIWIAVWVGCTLWEQIVEKKNVAVAIVASVILVVGVVAYLREPNAPPATPEYPRPDDAGFIDWLRGEHIVAEKHFWSDDTWTIQPNEVSDFNVATITINPADKTFAATLSFNASNGGKGIECQGVMIYKPVQPYPKLAFVSFTPTSVKKIGNW